MTFSTIVAQASSKVLDVPGGTSDHVPIQQFKNNNGSGLGTPNQQWFILPVAKDEDNPLDVGYFIVSRATGQLLTVSSDDWDQHARPTRVIQGFRYPGTPQVQAWSIRENSDASNCIYSMLGDLGTPNPQVLDVPADQLYNDGAKVQLWPFHGGINQRWSLVQQDIKVFAMFSRANRKVMDVPAFSHGDELVNQNQYNGGPNQLWMINPPEWEGQYHRITAVHSDKLLQLSRDGRLMQAAYDPNSQNQQWEMIPAINDSFIFQNRGTGKALDVSLDHDGRILQNVPDGSANQEWWTREVRVLYQILEF